jgi:hypothetical protein
MHIFSSILGLAGGLLLLVIFAGLFVLVFEILMFISAVTNTAISNETRILWLVGMVLLHPFVAIAYYFTDHQKRTR